MAQLGETFDATTVEPNAPRELLPPGKYLAHLVQSAMEPTKSGSGQFLSLEFDILSGDFQGRKAWDRLNIVNNNAQAVEIAHRTLSAICHAVNKMQVNDSEELHFLPLVITLKVVPEQTRDGKTYAPKNEISGYEAAASGAASVAAAKPTTQPAQSRPATPPANAAPVAAKAATPPWRTAKAA
jgi:hypothetical protein